MAEYHVRAVQEYSKIEDFQLRHLLEIIALDINYDDSPAYTSNRKLATRSRCAVNTVRDRVSKLAESGELIVKKQGQRMLYSINRNLIPYSRTNPKRAHETVGEGKGLEPASAQPDLIQLDKMYQEHEQKLYQLYQTQEKLYQKLYQKHEAKLYQLYQNAVSTVSALAECGDTEVLEVLKDPPYSPPLSPKTVSGAQGDKIVAVGENENENALGDLAEYFSELFGVLAVNATRDLWWDPLVEICRMSGMDFGTTKDFLDYLHGIARGKYTIKTPKSLLNIARNNHAKFVKSKTESKSKKIADQIAKNVSRYGRPNFETVKRVSSDEELEIIRKMGGWGAICSTATSKHELTKRVMEVMDKCIPTARV